MKIFRRLSGAPIANLFPIVTGRAEISGVYRLTLGRSSNSAARATPRALATLTSVRTDGFLKPRSRSAK